MILKVGITGGIGSGKSTVAKIFEVLGIPVFYADDAAKELMNKDEKLKQQLIKEFGNDLYLNGELNRPYLSSLVFADSKKLALLNAIVHPATIANAEKWMHQQTAPYAIKEAALIFESDAHKQLDKVIGVYAPTSLRLQRVRQRDNISEEAIMARMNKQMDEEAKMKLCDYIITNNELELIIPQVLQIHDVLLTISGYKN